MLGELDAVGSRVRLEGVALGLQSGLARALSTRVRSRARRTTSSPSRWPRRRSRSLDPLPAPAGATESKATHRSVTASRRLLLSIPSPSIRFSLVSGHRHPPRSVGSLAISKFMSTKLYPFRGPRIRVIFCAAVARERSGIDPLSDHVAALPRPGRPRIAAASSWGLAVARTVSHTAGCAGYADGAGLGGSRW